MTSLPEALTRSAEGMPGKGVTLFDSRGRNEERRTYGELLESARAAAARMAALGVGPGEPVLVCLPTSWAWLESWLGALLLGGLPVAVAPGPMLGPGEEHLRKVEELRRHLKGRLVICPARLASEAGELHIFDPGSVVTDPEGLAAASPAPQPREIEADPEATAFLQLTSGTTGRQRAVMIPHRAAAHNAVAIGRAMSEPLGVAPAEFPAYTVVSWLPLYHDMGLVGCLLTGILHGLDVQLLPPQAFLGRPRLWLEALSRIGKTVSAAPNFGYQLCLERLTDEEISRLDLSGWRAALVGAEMVRIETTEAFLQTFEPRGLPANAFRPCYGMAEATLAVTLDQKAEGPRSRPLPGGESAGWGLTSVVSLGAPIADTEIRVTGPDGGDLGEGRIGEIRVRGPGIFAGYRNDPEATAESLDGDWLLTGDLGFLEQGELYITGRIKDVLVVRGQNVMPHEVEQIAESAAGGGGVCRAGAFTVVRGAEGEEIVLVAETAKRDPEVLREMEREIRRRIGLSFSLPIADVAFVPAGRLPRTTSGKVRRRQLRDSYLERRLERMES